jgi:hypothetical protein
VRAQARHRGGGPMADVHGGNNGVGMRPSVVLTEEQAARYVCGRIFFKFFLAKRWNG